MWSNHVTQVEVASSVITYSGRSTDNHRLSAACRHVGRSVRVAVDEVFGGGDTAVLRPDDVASCPLAERHFKWQDFADEYLTYVLDAVVRPGSAKASQL